MALLVVQRDTIFPLSGEFTNCKYTCMLYQHVWFKFRFVIIHIISDFGVMVSFNYFANVQGVPSLQVQARIVEEGLYTNTSVRQSLILNPLGTHCCLHPSSASHHLAVHGPTDYSRQDNKLKVTSLCITTYTNPYCYNYYGIYCITTLLLQYLVTTSLPPLLYPYITAPLLYYLPHKGPVEYHLDLLIVAVLIVVFSFLCLPSKFPWCKVTNSYHNMTFMFPHRQPQPLGLLWSPLPGSKVSG